MRINIRALAAVLMIATLVGGCSPNERRPGLWLNGDEAPYPADWRFAESMATIAVEVHTPYLLPHSVTIWCAGKDGELYVGASAPDTKRWPGWVDRNPDVRLGISGQIYSVRLVPLTDAAEITALQQVYRTKYQLPAAPQENPPAVRYWHVTAR